MYIIAVSYVSLYSQTSSVHKISATPSAANFTYPQSVFVDSHNGNIWVTDFDNNRVLRFDVSILTGVETKNIPAVPDDFYLSQNYPNPFNPATRISFSVPQSGPVRLTVYTLLGQPVAILFNAIASSGVVYSCVLNGDHLASGIYLYSLHSANGNTVKKMCLMK